MKKIITVTFCLLSMVFMVKAQNDLPQKVVKETDKKTVQVEKKSGQKINQRPDEKTVKKEPFDDADVKTMAEKCIVFDTEKGIIKLEMYPESAPQTVRSFLNLVALGMLDTTTFSRVVPNFVIQGGDLYTSQNLTDDMKWRAVKNIPDEPNQIRHERGIISMARSEEPNSASTNFFILLSPSTYLDNKFAAFGRVTEGIEVVESINKMEVENEKPKNPVRIKTATVEPCAIKEASKNELTEKPEAKEIDTRID